MKKKRLLLTALCATCAFCMTASIAAYAGINTNSPFGEGLISNGNINETNFMVLGDDDPGTINAKLGNSTYVITGADWRSVDFTHNNPIPKSDLVENSKIVLQYDIYKPGAMWAQNIYISPLNSTRGDWSANYMSMRINKDCVQGYAAPAGSEVWLKGGTEKICDNSSALIGTNGNTHTGNFGLNANTYFDRIAAGDEYCTYWLEYDINTKSLTIYAGNKESNVKDEYATVKNAFTLQDGVENFYMNFGYDNSYEIDNIKVYRTLNNETKTYLNCEFNNNQFMIGGSNEPADVDKLVVVGSSNLFSVKSYDTLITVINPSQDARLTTLNPIKIDNSMEKTFDFQATYRLNTLLQTSKVGIGLGLKKYDVKLSAPADGASFIFFTLDENGKIVLGAENIAENGTETKVGELNVLENEIGSDITINFVGKQDNSVDVIIGEDSYNFPGLKLNGHITFAQIGTGDINYSILANTVEITAYEFKENEGESITANFDGNYLSTSKFAIQSTTAPEGYYTMQETTAHEVSGIVAEDGKIGFYGTSTNSRLMLKNKYSDFVLQFDYISDPIAKRALPGGITTAGNANRYSPFYVLFGASNEIPELKDTYALGIIEGNPTQYFWGAESLLVKEAKLGSGSVIPLSTLVECEKSETAIPWYGSKDGGFDVIKYGQPNSESKYSFYNKTSRIKLVVINNNVSFYAAPVNEDGTVGDYVLLYSDKVDNSFGNVGFGTDAPGWATIDNIAITPISKEVAIEKGLTAVAEVNLVADVAVADMVTDREPAPLAKAVVTVDTVNKTAKWNAVENAKEYEVVVKLGTEQKISKTITTTEIDLSELTADGRYSIIVTSVPTDEELYLKSRSVEVTYTIEKAQEPSNKPASGGCKGIIGSEIAIMSIVPLIAVAFITKKNKKQ